MSNIGKASSGKVLQGGGTGSSPVFSTATYPSTATGTGKVLVADGTNWVASTPTYPNSASGTGTILRADGTNWVATTSTYPNTNAISTLLYASSANVMSALATANSGVLSTSSTGVPSIDTTNFAVLSTGLQLKGNNTNTAPPAGFIGEQIRSQVGVTTVTTSNTNQNLTSISLTAGIWDVSCCTVFASVAVAGTKFQCSISTTSATLGTLGDNSLESTFAVNTVNDLTITIPSYRLTLSATTTVYLVILSTFASGMNCSGRISGTRVG